MPEYPGTRKRKFHVQFGRKLSAIYATYSEPSVVEDLLNGDSVIHVRREHSLYEILGWLADGVPQWRFHLQISRVSRHPSRTKRWMKGEGGHVGQAQRNIIKYPANAQCPQNRGVSLVFTCTRPLQIASRSLSREPTNGSVPVSRTWSSTPADQTSPGFPYCLRWITSGAMKCGQPTRPERPRTPLDACKTIVGVGPSWSVAFSDCFESSQSIVRFDETFETGPKVLPLSYNREVGNFLHQLLTIRKQEQRDVFNEFF